MSVSLSLDGPGEIHNKHRFDHAGRPSFEKAEAALRLLEQRPRLFSGVIAVIDAQFPPEVALQYFSQFKLPNLDFLLPDANYSHLPPGKSEQPSLYKDWLMSCFDLWFDHFPDMPIRFFDAILGAVVGLPSKTDALGFGDVSLLTIETDGSYHDLDVLKIAYAGATDLQLGSVLDAPISRALETAQIKQHRRLLSRSGLCLACQQCEVVDVCAGGAVPHRYSTEGFSNPSIYCEELFTLIKHAQGRLGTQVEADLVASKEQKENISMLIDLEDYENTARAYPVLNAVMEQWQNTQYSSFKEALAYVALDQRYSSPVKAINDLAVQAQKRLCVQPSIVAWTSVALAHRSRKEVVSIDGAAITFDPAYIHEMLGLAQQALIGGLRLHRTDQWLRLPFGNKIVYEPNQVIDSAQSVISEAYRLIEEWDSEVIKEIYLIAPELQFIKDTTAHPDKVVSFSDNSVPGALYVTVRLGDRLIDPADLADSILHEYRHQKLYLLQRVSDIVAVDVPFVKSPWREELRPPSGLFHALYVFTFLRKFWLFLCKRGPSNTRVRAQEEVRLIEGRIHQGMQTVRGTCLTKTGSALLDIIESEIVETIV
ncbi:MAG: FxsB family radical SAM/SPASM domain protein [Proteobacteria bacterium]|nr:MAG: FxsB family radical SAM/SPASM domain protein [Pseudomonadota bacterium]